MTKTYYWYWSFSGQTCVRSKKPKNISYSTLRAGNILEAERVARDFSMLARNTKGWRHKHENN